MNNKLSEPSDNITDTLNSLRGWKQLAEAAEKRISALLAELEAKDKRIAELESGNALMTNQRDLWYGKVRDLEGKLATPLRLPDGTGWASDPYNQGRNKGIHQCADAIRAAGFTVGDE